MKIGIFLADDHTVVRDGLRMLIEAEEDLQVVGEAGDGAEAVRLIEMLKPAVAVIDLTMPKLDGIAVLERICGEPCPKTIVLSMHAGRAQIFKALRAGASGYLLKESAGSEVVAAIRAVLAGNRYLSGKVTEIVINDYVRGRPGRRGQNDSLGALSEREHEVLQMMAEGKSTAETAGVLLVSPKTVETYRRRIMLKLGLSDSRSLMKFAIANVHPSSQ